MFEVRNVGRDSARAAAVIGILIDDRAPPRRHADRGDTIVPPTLLVARTSGIVQIPHVGGKPSRGTATVWVLVDCHSLAGARRPRRRTARAHPQHASEGDHAGKLRNSTLSCLR